MASNKLFHSYRSLPNLPELSPSPSPPPNTRSQSATILNGMKEFEPSLNELEIIECNDKMNLHQNESDINDQESQIYIINDEEKVTPKYRNISPISTLSTYQFKYNIYHIPSAKLHDFWMKIFYFNGENIHIQNSAKYQLLQFVNSNGSNLNFRLTKSTKINTEYIQRTMISKKRTFNACDGLNHNESNKKIKINATSSYNYNSCDTAPKCDISQFGPKSQQNHNPILNAEIVLLPIGIAADNGEFEGNNLDLKDQQIIDVIVVYIVNNMNDNCYDKECEYEYTQIEYNEDKECIMSDDEEWLIIMMTSCLLLGLLGIYWGSWIIFEFYSFGMSQNQHFLR